MYINNFQYKRNVLLLHRLLHLRQIKVFLAMHLSLRPQLLYIHLTSRTSTNRKQEDNGLMIMMLNEMYIATTFQ